MATLIEQLQEEFSKYGYTSNVAKLAQNIIDRGNLEDIYKLKDVQIKHIRTHEVPKYTQHTDTDYFPFFIPFPIFVPIETSRTKLSGYETVDESYYGNKGELYEKILANQILPLSFFKDYEKSKDVFGRYITTGKISNKIIKTQQDFEFVLANASDESYTGESSVLDKVLSSMPYASETSSWQFVPNGDAIFANGISGWFNATMHGSEMSYIKALNRVTLTNETAERNTSFLLGHLATAKDEAVLEIAKFFAAYPPKDVEQLNSKILKNPYSINHLKELFNVDGLSYDTKHILAKWAYLYGSPELIVNNYDAINVYHSTTLLGRLFEISTDEFLIDNLQVIGNSSRYIDQLYHRIAKSNNFENMVKFFTNIRAYNEQLKNNPKDENEVGARIKFPLRYPDCRDDIFKKCKAGVYNVDQLLTILDKGFENVGEIIFGEFNDFVFDQCQSGRWGYEEFRKYVTNINANSKLDNVVDLVLYQNFVMQQCQDGKWTFAELDDFINNRNEVYVSSFLKDAKPLVVVRGKSKIASGQSRGENKLHKKRIVRLYRDVTKLVKHNGLQGSDYVNVLRNSYQGTRYDIKLPDQGNAGEKQL